MKILLLLFFLIFLVLDIQTTAQVRKADVTIAGEDITIAWLSESNDVNFYELERKPALMGEWKKIHKFNPLNRKKFVHTDSNLPGEMYFYRIKSVMKDGTSRYSEIFEADLNNPFSFKLNQNFPNPFNPETSIKFSIPKSGYVDLTIYNLLGQKIRTLVEGYREAGDYTVNFNADELNSGLYIYKLISGDNVLTRKMTLVK
jgi:hypothetical protein